MKKVKIDGEYVEYPPERARTAQEAALFQEDVGAELTESELIWTNRYKLLEDHGYRLRPRFQPDWKPSWFGTDRNPVYCEDCTPHTRHDVIDAVRLSDNKTVAIKAVKIGKGEVDIGRFFSSPDLRSDPHNHCVPILDVIHDERDPEYDFIVMPVLRRYDSPNFVKVSEIIDFIQQTLEGLAFMHKHDVAHRDCALLNIMMDGSALYPDGFHFSSPEDDVKGIYPAKYIPRHKVKNVKYYFIDFDMSTQFHDGDYKMVVGRDGADRDAPEFSSNKVYDPFALDVFILGHAFEIAFLSRYRNFDFMAPLVEAMMNHNPKERPKAAEALEQFNNLIAKQNALTVRWRLQPQKVGVVSRVRDDIGFVITSIVSSPLVLARKVISILPTGSKKPSRPTAATATKPTASTPTANANAITPSSTNPPPSS